MDLDELKATAILVDKYMYTGLSSTCIIQDLDEKLGNDAPCTSQGHFEEPSLSTHFPDMLCLAMLFNLPKMFSKASRLMMWWLSRNDIDAFLQEDLANMLPVNLLEVFEDEHNRLRSHLINKLPTVFYPDDHGAEQGQCSKCIAVEHKDRWFSEVINKILVAPYYVIHGYAAFFEACVSLMQLLDRPRIAGEDEKPLPCGRFRVRFLDVTRVEMMQELYNSIGGMCLECFKEKDCTYKLSCQKHNVWLGVD